MCGRKNITFDYGNENTASTKLIKPVVIENNLCAKSFVKLSKGFQKIFVDDKKD